MSIINISKFILLIFKHLSFMANKTKRFTRNSKKEKGEFRKNKVGKTDYQKSRDDYKNRRKRNGNYAVEPTA